MAYESHKNNALYTQIKEAYGRVLYSQTTHVKQYLLLEKQHRCIKFIQIIISAFSTVGFFGSVITDNAITTWIGGIFAIILLIINLLFKEFDLGSIMSQHRKTSDELWLIREQYASLLTDFDCIGESELRKKRDKLQRKTYDVYKDAPKTNEKSYAKAKKALKNEEEQFFSADELNRILPSHLRSKE